MPTVLTDLVGRDLDLERARDLLAHSRTLCVVGPGGVGKTRLAMELATRLEWARPDTVRWVDLAPRTDPASVPCAFADALDVRQEPGGSLVDSIGAVIADRPLTVVLDNCEHVLAGCAVTVVDLLGQCPALRVVTTSRERLGIPGEVVCPLPALVTPPEDATTCAQVFRFPAALLFAERARAVRPDLTIDDAAAVEIARICRALDGSPLAIELAAARTSVLSVAEIADALADRLVLLTTSAVAADERHRSLRAVLDWSHRLLTAPERRLLAAVSVFPGSFGLDAAEAVCVAEPGDPPLIDVVSRLVDRSLVATVTDDDGGRTRYVLSETVRLYAAEQLDASDRAGEVHGRAVRWCVELAHRAVAEVSGPRQARWMTRLDAERGTVNVALKLARSPGGHPEDALRTAADLWPFRALRGDDPEGRRVLREALAAPPAGEAAGNLNAERPSRSTTARSATTSGSPRRWAVSAAWPASREGTRPPRTITSKAFDCGRRLGDEDGAAAALDQLSLLTWIACEVEAATRLAGGALAVHRARGDRGGTTAVRVVENVPRIVLTALGAARVEVAGRVLSAADFGYAKPRELLFFLLDTGGNGVGASKDQIGLALWPWASPARLRGSFHTTLHHLRATLPADRIRYAGGRYRFDRSLPFWYDVEQFERCAEGSGHDALSRLAEAATLYRGDYLADLPGEGWIAERRAQLRRTHQRVLSRLARQAAEDGRLDDAIEVLHRIVAEDPLRESAQRDLIRYYAAAGHRGSALRQFHQLREVLHAELCAPPEEETVALVARIRRGEPVVIGPA